MRGTTELVGRSNGAKEIGFNMQTTRSILDFTTGQIWLQRMVSLDSISLITDKSTSADY